ncbi:MAG: hypothetical protein OEW45_05510 [Deltaproteobacteria bacterium]|nr:hypothetical protein [Deltaproteobacteria bacterium]
MNRAVSLAIFAGGILLTIFGAMDAGWRYCRDHYRAGGTVAWIKGKWNNSVSHRDLQIPARNAES